MTQEAKEELDEILGSEGWRHFLVLVIRKAARLRERLLHPHDNDMGARAEFHALKNLMKETYQEAGASMPTYLVNIFE